MNLSLKNGVAHACKIAASTLDMLETKIQPGITTQEIDDICTHFIHGQGAKSGCLGYKGYPKNICTSLNEVACHGIPSGKKLKAGDILNVDIVVQCNGYYGDTARMYLVGDVSAAARKLCEATRNARDAGIAVIKPGIKTGDIGYAIETCAKNSGFQVIEGYCGHGIGTAMHEDPQIPNYGTPNTGQLITEGMIFTVEPIITIGRPETHELSDGWTVVTSDGAWCAQCEHTIYVSEDGPEILT